MKSTRYERHMVWCRSCHGMAARNPTDLGAPTLVRHPQTLSIYRVVWLIVFACCMATLAIGGYSAAFMLVLLIGLIIVHEYVRVIFGREEVRFDSQNLEYLWVDGILRHRKVVPMAEILRVIPYGVMVSGGQNQPPHPEYGVLIESIGWPLRIGQGRDPDEADRLQEWIESQLRAWEPTWENVPCCEDREVMNASCTLSEEPSDCTIDCRREWDRTEFRIRISAKVWFTAMLLAALVMVGSAMPGALFLSLFGPRVGWFILPYLILLGSAGVIWVLPWASWQLGNRRWVVRPGEVTMSVPKVGIGRTRTIEVEWLDRIELRRIQDASWRRVPGRIEVGSSPYGFELALIDLNEHDLAILGPLSEGEARWMAGIIADVFKDALPKTGQSFERWSVSVDAPAGGSQEMGDAWLDELNGTAVSIGPSKVAIVPLPPE